SCASIRRSPARCRPRRRSTRWRTRSTPSCATPTTAPASCPTCELQGADAPMERPPLAHAPLSSLTLRRSYASAAPKRIGVDRTWRTVGLAPSIAVFACLTLLPIANLVAMSFHDVAWIDGRSQWTFVGLRHYAALPEDTLLRAGLGNTFFFAVVSTAIQMAL